MKLSDRFSTQALEACYRHEDLKAATSEILCEEMAAILWLKVRNLAIARNRAAWAVEMESRYFQRYGGGTPEGWAAEKRRLGIR